MKKSYMVFLGRDMEGFRPDMHRGEIYEWRLGKAQKIAQAIRELFPKVSVGECTVFGFGCDVPEEDEKEFAEKVGKLTNVEVVVRDVEF